MNRAPPIVELWVIANTTLTGKATFGLVSKHRKGENTPTDKTGFHFRKVELNFLSTEYY